MRQSPKIPIWAAIILLILLVGGIQLITQFIIHPSHTLTENEVPQAIKITNISDKSATITWITDDATTGSVSVHDVSNKQQLEVRDIDTSGSLYKTKAHSVTVLRLTPQTTYALAIKSNGTDAHPEDQPYTFQTARVITSDIPQVPPASGAVVDQNNIPVVGALVYLSTEGGQTVSTRTNDQGKWLIPVNLVRTSTLDAYLSWNTPHNQTINVAIGQDSAQATILSNENTAVRTITLGKTYDFRAMKQETQNTKASFPLALAPVESTPAVLGESDAPSLPLGQYTISITQPDEGASLVSNLPLFQGKGIPGRTVIITVGLKGAQTFKTVVNSDGIWQQTPAKPLGIGKQSITMTTTDAKKKAIAITHTFDILKSGTQVLGDATPSATLAITQTPTPTIGVTITATPEASPSGNVVGNPPPVSGSAEVTYLVLGISLLLVFLGSVGYFVL